MSNLPVTSKLALVTGAAGFIGSHLVESLLGDGWSVRCLLRYGSGGSVGYLADLPQEAREGLDIRRGDLLDHDYVDGCMDGVDTVFHLAARISIPYSYTAPRDTFEVNAIGTLNVLDAARRHQVRRLVHTSTSEVYGTAETVPMSEHHPLKAQSPYAASKIAADKLVESYVKSFELPAVVVRPFNTYGPRQSPRAVIPAIIQQAQQGGQIRLGALWPRRDFTYVADTVNGFMRAATVDAALGGVFNLGVGSDIGIGELVERVQQILGTRCDVVADDARLRPPASEVGRLLSDNRLARDVLGWVPETSIDTGLRATAEWWATRGNAFGWTHYAI